jgi:hypothetical protein
LGLKLRLELLPCGALLGKMLRCRQSGLLGAAIGRLLCGQLGGTLPGSLLLRLLFPGLLFLGPLFPGPLFPGPLFSGLLFSGLLFLGLLFSGQLLLGLLLLSLTRGTFRGLLCGEFGGGSRCLPCALFCFQMCRLLRGLLGGAVCLLFRGHLRGALRLAGCHFSSKLGLARLLLLTSPDDCQILLFRGAPGVSGLNFFPLLLLLLFHGLLGTQANLLPRLRSCRGKVPVFCSVQIRP